MYLPESPRTSVLGGARREGVWVVSWAKCRQFAEDHADALQPLERWYDTTEKAEWKSFADVRQTFGKTVDRYGSCYVFDIHGGHYRLIATISKGWKKVYIRHILTHAEYDRDTWKGQC
jgi:mRNA interferase HigB